MYVFALFIALFCSLIVFVLKEIFELGFGYNIEVHF